MKIELFSRRTLMGRKWFFRVIAANGEKIAQSEGYSRKIDAVGTAYLLKNGTAKAEVLGAGKDSGDLR